MALAAEVLTQEHLEIIFSLENERLQLSIDDETARVFAVWNARWRREALEFYLKLGWCFGAFENGRLVGYYLAQPFLFFRGHAQTLWVEHLSYTSRAVKEMLLEIAYKVARDKHLQRVLIASDPDIEEGLAHFKPKAMTDVILELSSTKG